MAYPRSTRGIAAELEASKAAKRAFWAGLLAPLAGVVIASYATYNATTISDMSRAALAFLLIGGFTFAPAVFVRASARRGVLARLVAGEVATLSILSLAAIGLSSDEMSQTLLVLATLWIVALGSSITGHALGAVVAARRAEGSVGGADDAILTDVERRAIHELEYATRGWQIEQVSRLHAAGDEDALQVELETRILATHGYRLVGKVREGGSVTAAVVGLVSGFGGDDERVRVTYERTTNDGTPRSAPAVAPTTEWEKHARGDQR
jgi:hypothetical protein